MKNWFLNFIIGIFCLSIIVIIVIISAKEFTGNEATLISVLLTFISIIATWIVSQYFSDITHKKAIEEVRKEHSENLRTYALNAAEKVDNLSNELSRLAIYLQSEQNNDYDSTDEAVIKKSERIESAIHITNTLKSVNDTSLSDWQGVIGEELEEREEEKEERENRLFLLTERLENLVSEKANFVNENDFEKIKNQIKFLLNANNLPLIKRKSTKPLKRDIEKECPICKSIIKYKQRPNERGFKTVKCDNCNAKFLSRYIEEKGFYLENEQFIKEEIECPWCAEKQFTEFSNLPFISNVVKCNNCNNRIKITRNTNNVLGIKRFGNPVQGVEQSINDELLENIEKKLPQQPWPSGIHKEIATKLNIPSKIVTSAINILIKRGKVNPQINGVVYVRQDTERL